MQHCASNGTFVERGWGNGMRHNLKSAAFSRAKGTQSMTMKAAALRGSSTLAIGRSMRRIVLPGLITVCAMSVIPENQLSAYGTANPGAHFAGTILAPAADRGSPDQGVRPFGIEGRAPRTPASQIGLQTAVPGSGRDWPLTPVTGSGDPVPLAPGGGLMDYSLEAVLAPNRRTAVVWANAASANR